LAVSSFLQRIANLVVQHRRGLLDRLAGQLRKRLFVLHLLRIEELVDALVGVLGVAVQAGEGFLDGLSCLCLLRLAVGDGDRAGGNRAFGRARGVAFDWLLRAARRRGHGGVGQVAGQVQVASQFCMGGLNRAKVGIAGPYALARTEACRILRRITAGPRCRWWSM